MDDTVIIGAGVAGAAAAAVLRDTGREVVLLDKATHPGGRCATRRVAQVPDSAWFDYGAQYFTARDERFREVVDADLEAGRLTTWSPDTCAARYDAAHGWQIESSPDTRERLIAPHGLGGWVRDRVALTGAEVRCNSPATGVAHAGDHWQIFVENSETLAARDLIVTLPAPQCAALLGNLGAAIAVLADADRALSACHSLVVAAPALANCQAMFVKDGILSWIADNNHKHRREAHSNGDPSSRLWTMHAGPEYSDAHLDDDPDTVQATLIGAFAAVTGFDAATIKPVRAHRWRYARPGPGAPDAATLCHADRERGLALAGDWLAGGRVEGAWLSGDAAARRLLGG